MMNDVLFSETLLEAFSIKPAPVLNVTRLDSRRMRSLKSAPEPNYCFIALDNFRSTEGAFNWHEKQCFTTRHSHHDFCYYKNIIFQLTIGGKFPWWQTFSLKTCLLCRVRSRMLFDSIFSSVLCSNVGQEWLGNQIHPFTLNTKDVRALWEEDSSCRENMYLNADRGNSF